jgi:hypothetical protein
MSDMPGNTQGMSRLPVRGQSGNTFNGMDNMPVPSRMHPAAQAALATPARQNPVNAQPAPVSPVAK